jgi:hypothetical protein
MQSAQDAGWLGGIDASGIENQIETDGGRPNRSFFCASQSKGRRVLGEKTALRGQPPIEGDLPAQLPRWIQHLREVIPKEAEQMERMPDEIMAGTSPRSAGA